jgi:hypothetical protein
MRHRSLDATGMQVSLAPRDDDARGRGTGIHDGGKLEACAERGATRGRGRLHQLHRELRVGSRNAGEIRELVEEELFIRRGIRNGDEEEIVGTPEHAPAFGHFVQLLDGALEGFARLAVLHRHFDVEHDLEATADRSGVDRCVVAADHAGAFQVANPPETRCRGEVDAARELGVGQAPFSFELGDDRAVDCVHRSRSC